MLSIRWAEKKDAALVMEFIRGLAEYEREPHKVIATEADLVRDGFGARPLFRVLLAEWDGTPAGYAFFYWRYSTWLGRAGIHLEDLFVLPKFRGKGIGGALLREVAQVAEAEKCYGVVWEVLDWNQPAIDFYHAIGAEFREQWRVMWLRGEALERFAAGADKARETK